jgi:MFS family permease
MSATIEGRSKRNIRLTLAFTALAFAGRSIWSQSVLATYVYLLSNHNPAAVGFLTAVMGMFQLLASFPTGYLADRQGLRRETLLQVASCIGVLAMAVTITALYLPTHKNNVAYLLLACSLAIWGVFWGVANTVLEAIFADSTPSGTRSKYYTKRSILINMGNTFGPLLALLFFLTLGDEWTTRDCAKVMTLGQCICFPAVMILCCFADERYPEYSDDSLTATTMDNSLEEPLLAYQDEDFASDNDSDAEADTDADVESAEGPSTIEYDEASSSSTSFSSDMESRSFFCARRKEQQQQASDASRIFGCIPKNRLAPVLISISDLSSGLASGMSIRYFPIFFLDRLRLSPVQVQILYIVTPIIQACLMKSGQYVSQKMGRCQVTILHRWIGIACMFLMIGLAYGFDDHHYHEYCYYRWLICVIYILRTGFMNSTSPLTKSLLMDSVPAHERGRWTSLESVNTFSWSGSAFLGGVLVQVDGLLFNFIITATLQFLATIPIVLLILTNDPQGDVERIRDDTSGPETDEGVTSMSSPQDTPNRASSRRRSPKWSIRHLLGLSLTVLLMTSSTTWETPVDS